MEEPEASCSVEAACQRPHSTRSSLPALWEGMIAAMVAKQVSKGKGEQVENRGAPGSEVMHASKPTHYTVQREVTSPRRGQQQCTQLQP